MSLVNLLNVEIKNPVAPFLQPFQFEITFELIGELSSDLEFKVVYVGSAGSEKDDQVLESVMVGPVPLGVCKFVLEAPPPTPSKIPPTEAIGLTVLLLSVSYLAHEFVRVGYYVNNEFGDAERAQVYAETGAFGGVEEFNGIVRNVLADKPKVTRFPIKWDGQDSSEGGQDPTKLGQPAVQESTTTIEM